MKKIFIAAGPIIALMISAVSINAQTQSREDLFRDIAAKRAELLKLQKAYLAPSEEDLAKYGDFLRLPDTGLIRLLPRENFDVGAFYSFKERTHDYVNST